MTNEEIAAAIARGDALSRVLSQAELQAWARTAPRSLIKAATIPEFATRLTSGEVAFLYCITRNTICGTWHRAGLTRKNSAPVKRPANRPVLRRTATPNALHMGTGSLAQSQACCIAINQNLGDRSPDYKGTNPAIVTNGYDPVSEPLIPLSGSEAEAGGPSPASAFNCEGIDLAALRDQTCKFPLGSVNAAPPYRYCGAPVVDRSYCLGHFVRSVDPRYREIALKRLGYPMRERAALIRDAEAARRAR